MITRASLLSWAHAMLIWMVAHYTFHRPAGARSGETPVLRLRTYLGVLVPVGASALVLGGLTGSWWLAALAAICGSALTTFREEWPDRHAWEREIAVTAAFSWAALFLVERQSLIIRNPLMTLATSPEHIAVACLVSALFLFTLSGGTYIVRGILTASGVPQADATEQNRATLKHGRWIGALERAVLFVVLIAGSYEALGFIVAAKGLIRSRQFEKQREFTEYFLIGSLSSVAVALATGTAARYLVQKYW